MKTEILEFEDALNILQLEGNWKHFGLFYKGRISNLNPLVMSYNDGDIEQIELSQLRGKLPRGLKKGR